MPDNNRPTHVFFVESKNQADNHHRVNCRAYMQPTRYLNHSFMMAAVFDVVRPFLSQHLDRKKRRQNKPCRSDRFYKQNQQLLLQRKGGHHIQRTDRDLHRRYSHDLSSFIEQSRSFHLSHLCTPVSTCRRPVRQQRLRPGVGNEPHAETCLEIFLPTAPSCCSAAWGWSAASRRISPLRLRAHGGNPFPRRRIRESGQNHMHGH